MNPLGKVELYFHGTGEFHLQRRMPQAPSVLRRLMSLQSMKRVSGQSPSPFLLILNRLQVYEFNGSVLMSDMSVGVRKLNG
jgi:hypothetical protein